MRQASYILKAEHRRAMLALDYPHVALSPEEAKTIEPCQITLKHDKVWVTIRGARRDKKAGWYLDYCLVDYRPRFMRRNPHGMNAADIRSRMDIYGVPKRVSEQDAAEAAEASHYTGSHHQAVAGEAEDVVPADYQTKLTVMARRDRAEVQAAERLEESFESQCKNFTNELRGIGRSAAKNGIDAGALLAPLMRDFQQAIREHEE